MFVSFGEMYLIIGDYLIIESMSLFTDFVVFTFNHAGANLMIDVTKYSRSVPQN